MLGYLSSFYERSKKNKIQKLLLHVSNTIIFVNFSIRGVNFIINSLIMQTPKEMLFITEPDYTNLLNLLFVRETIIICLCVIAILIVRDRFMLQKKS